MIDKFFSDRVSWHNWLLLLPILLVYFFSLPVPVMEVDAAQYAAMAREMLETGNFLQIYDRGNDYLDKPPLLFWLSSLSYAVFGYSTAAYKLPSLLFALLGIFSTYKFGEVFYGKRAAFWAALFLASSQALFLMILDPRTDTLLMGATIFAVWQIAAFLKTDKWLHFTLGFMGIGLAMLAKGPIGLMIPVLGFGTHFIIKKQWTQVFRWEWAFGILIIAGMLGPMAWGLYQQFDLQPEKVVYGEKGHSGLKFYFWDQSFGRLTGDNPFINQGKDVQGDDPTFFIHTFLWTFLPWSFLFLAGLVFYLKRWWNTNYRFAAAEYVSWAAILFSFLAFTFSDYKLPHYIFIVYPLIAVQTGRFYILGMKGGWKKSIVRIQYFIVALLWVLTALLAFWIFPVKSIAVAICIILLFMLVVYIIYKKRMLPALVHPSLVSIIAVNLYLMTSAYPSLLKYQASSEAGMYIRDHEIPVQHLYYYNAFGYALDFYSGKVGESVNTEKIIKKPAGESWYVFTDSASLINLKAQSIPLEIVESFQDYRITLLKWEFLNPQTREEAVKNKYLVKLPSE